MKTLKNMVYIKKNFFFFKESPKPTVIKRVKLGHEWPSDRMLTLNVILEYLFTLSNVRLFCKLMDGSGPGFSVREISQARILEWLPFPTQGLNLHLLWLLDCRRSLYR